MLYGRADELANLERLVEAARTGQAGAVLLRGEPGVGKSALLEAITGRADDFRVLKTQGVESEAEFAFGNLHELIQPALSRIHRLPSGQASAMKIAFGMEEGAVTEPFLISVGSLSLIAELSEETPVLCLIDDVHWLDRASATALSFVARRLQAERVAIVFAVREEEASRFDPTGIRELRLERLDETASRELLTQKFPSVAPHVADHLIETTMGNPLALVEIAGTLSEPELDGSTGLPDHLAVRGSLGEAFLAQIRRLDEITRRALLIIATDDTGSLAIILDASSRLGIPSGVLDRIEATAIVDIEDRSMRFRHPLLRSAVLDLSLRADRRQVHTVLAGTYRASGDLERAAQQVAASVDGRDETAASELEAAATLARRRGGFEVACHTLEHAAALTPDSDAQERRLLAAAGDAWNAGLLDKARELLDSAQNVAIDTPHLPDALRLRAWIELTEGSVPTAQELLWKGAREVFSTDRRLSLEMAASAAEAAWVESDVVALAEMGSMLPMHQPAEGSGSYHRLLLVGFTADAAGGPRDSMAALTEAVRLAEGLGDPDILNSAGHVAFYIGDDEAATRINTRVVATSRVDGSTVRLCFALERQARTEILGGRWSLAAATLEELFGLAQATGRWPAVAVAIAWQAYLSAVRGSDDVRFLITQAQARAATISLGTVRQLFEAVIAWAEAIGHAIEERHASSYQRLASIRHPAMRSMTAFDLVEEAIRAGFRTEANEAIEWAESFAATTGASWASALAAYGRAQLSDENAESQLREAIEKSHRPFEQARIHLALGAHLRRNRQRTEARPHLETAVAAFESMGARPWAERASQELRASGKTARRRDASTVFDLTPQELQVARFVSQGFTNREVAERLFLSPRTVDYHLRKIFVKLGISSRSRLSQFSFE